MQSTQGDASVPAIGITLRKSSSTPVGARVVKGGREGLYGRPGVVGTLTVRRQAEVSRRPMADDHKGPHHIHPRPYADGYPVLQGTQGDASVPTLIRTAPAPTQVDGWGFGCQCSLEPFELMFRFPGSFASQPQTRHRSGHLTHVTVRAASTAQYLHQLSRQMVLVQLLVEGEQAVDTLVEEALAVAPLVDPVHQQSVRSAGHQFVAI